MINNTTYRLYGRTKGRKKNKNNYSFLKIKLINIDHTKYNNLDIGSGFGESTIKIAKKLLKKGGLIFVYVPNWNCAQRLLVGEKNSVFINPTHHLTYFTPKTLSLFFQKLKFKTIFWETKGLDLEDYKSFIQKKKNKSFLGNLKNLDIEILQFYINASGNGKNLRMIVKKT